MAYCCCCYCGLLCVIMCYFLLVIFVAAAPDLYEILVLEMTEDAQLPERPPNARVYLMLSAYVCVCVFVCGLCCLCVFVCFACLFPYCCLCVFCHLFVILCFGASSERTWDGTTSLALLRAGHEVTQHARPFVSSGSNSSMMWQTRWTCRFNRADSMLTSRSWGQEPSQRDSRRGGELMRTGRTISTRL